MKIKNLAIAIAAATAASQSFALAPTVTPQVLLNISGATAMDKQFANYISNVCVPGTLDTYGNSDDSASAFFCQVSPATSDLTQTRNVLFRKASGGSSQGVGPVASAATNIPGLNLSTCTETAVGSRQWSCSNTTVQVQAMVGISDVEPKMFTVPQNGGQIFDNAGFSSVFPINTQTFGIVVTPDLRDALQEAQGLTVGSDEVSEMPSLSSATIASLASGQIATYSRLFAANGTSLNLLTNSVNSNDVEFCRRTEGSGTQAQFNAYYMGLPCNYPYSATYAGMFPSTDTNGVVNDIARPLPFPGAPFPLPGPYFHENSGSSDLGKCLTNLAAANRTGLGIQSLEKVDEGRVDRNNFKYIAIDGVAPTLENVHAGLYRNVASATIQWNSTVTGERLLLTQGLKDAAQATADVRDFNLSLQDDDPAVSSDNRPGAGLFRTPEILSVGVPANVGSMAIAGTAGAVADAVFVATKPVTPWNKGLSSPISCRIQVPTGSVSVAR